jgi:hypothetical protein
MYSMVSAVERPDYEPQFTAPAVTAAVAAAEQQQRQYQQLLQ